jgi:hypothetical protein
MKQIVASCLVIFLSTIGFKALADKIDITANSIAVAAADDERAGTNDYPPN